MGQGTVHSLGRPRGFDALEDRPEVDARAAPRMRVAMGKHGGRGAVRTKLPVRVRGEVGHGVDRDPELGCDVLGLPVPANDATLPAGNVSMTSSG